jgi:YHS domain-containing protein
MQKITFSWKKTPCQVCKGSFVQNETTEKVTYKDRVYSVCCVTCRSRFQENPEKYVKG